MKKILPAFFIFLLSLLLSLVLPGFIAPAQASDKDRQTHADIVLVNGSVYTMDASRRWVQAVAISNGRIVFAGTDQDAVKYAGPLSNVVNLQGKMVLPGFIDSHVHPIEGAIEEAGCYLANYESAESIKNAIGEYAKEHEKDEWVIGSGWGLPVFGPSGPRKEDLDQVVKDRPAYIVAQDGHSVWVNSKALELAGITSFTPDPPGGRIERVPGSKEPSGTLRESASNLFEKLLPKPDPEEYRQAALDVQKKFNALGITGVQDACVEEPALKAYAALDDSNLLTMRVSASMMLHADQGEAQIQTFKEWTNKYDGEDLRARSVKIFADGVIESKTAALLEPYLSAEQGDKNKDKARTEETRTEETRTEETRTEETRTEAEKTTDNGILEFSPALFKWYVTKLDGEGFQIHVHAIGDRAVRTALDSFATAKKLNGKSDKRHHIAHLELIDKADIDRFRELSVAANFQAFWAYRDKYITELTEPILGPERTGRLYPIASLFKSGALVVGGSDWTVTTANPLDAIQVAVTRAALNENADKAFIPEERVSLPEILSAYTINGAYLGHWERETGSLEVGKSADLIVLDKNLFAIRASDIHKCKVLWTLFKGRSVYKDPNFEI